MLINSKALIMLNDLRNLIYYYRNFTLIFSNFNEFLMLTNNPIIDFENYYIFLLSQHTFYLFAHFSLSLA